MLGCIAMAGSGAGETARRGRGGSGRSSLRELRLLERVGAVLRRSGDLTETLDSVVDVIAERMRTEVCSLYLLEDDQLTLSATTGLDRDAIGEVQMTIGEGLTGLVIESMDAVVVEDAPVHPRFKFFPELGEERYHSFLGVPVLEREAPLGVLVVQTLRRRSFTDDEVSLLRTIAHQIASVLVRAQLLDSLKVKEQEQADFRRRMLDAVRRLQAAGPGGDGGSARSRGERRDPGTRMRGISAVPGFGIGRAHILHPQVSLSEIQPAPSGDPAGEQRRFEEAVARAGEDLDRQRSKMDEILPEATGKIFDAYALMLRDTTFAERVAGTIAEGVTAEFAVREAVEGLAESFEGLDDPYMRERSLDIRDIGQRLLRILLGIEGREADQPELGSVLIASEVTMTDLSEIDLTAVRGIALATGSETSHATILAKSFEIPTVVGIEHILQDVAEGDAMIVDGNAGVVYREPGPDVVREYERMEGDYRAFNENLATLHDLPAETTDGRRVMLSANVGLVGDVVLADRHGAEGVGLYRTEFPFVSFREFPSEEEQYEIYRKVIRGMKQAPVTVRTLDVGADKYPTYLYMPQEDNPFLGWRSIRVSLEMPEFFSVQLRAIMRAAVDGPTRLLLPMISSMEEVHQARELIAETRESLEREGVPHVGDLPLGVMIEVPSAVYLAPQLVEASDFLSIGTNDLIQYVLAVDRNNRKVAPLYQPLHPAVLGTVDFVVRAARAGGKPVSMCGEMAADPMCTLILLGIGLDELSMEPFFIPVIKKLIRSVSLEAAQALSKEVLRLQTSREIKRVVFDSMRELGLIELLDMYQ